ncbi:hypothetical protein TrRE_jg1889 [Triparma retinervis]|uniref:C3H1-type domain-containing protein n=1 Tax=Triparma retinervis TaxID=2557542 RepID=A0A9W7DL90_9STRA|nr:hypothetical protein TrRE_jg1889 [Triparma retinervis]
MDETPFESKYKGYDQTDHIKLSATDRSIVLNAGTCKAGKKHTVTFRPVQRTGGENVGENVCYLYQRFVCPHGEGCKFLHTGEGGCKVKGDGVKRCFEWVKKGKCGKGDACKFKHDEGSKGSKMKKRPAAAVVEDDGGEKKKGKGENDCNNWKSKGKCRKGDKCPYRHDEGVRIRALAKRAKKSPPGTSVCVPVVEMDNKNGCLGVVLRGNIKADVKRSTVDKILKSLGAPKHKKVKVEEGRVEVTWTTKEKTEDGMVILSNENVRAMFGDGVGIEYKPVGEE